MKVVTSAQMGRIDAAAINDIGIPGVVLMENAALKVVDEVIKTLGSLCNKRIAVFAGKGNNGGDAFAVARHLFNKGAKVKVYLTSDRKYISGDAAINFHAMENTGVEYLEILEENQIPRLRDELGHVDLIVDGIFGTGLKGEVTGLIKEVIKVINNSCRPVISIDIPSGVSGDTGKVLGTCIKACKTVTFGLPKIGSVTYPGREYAGELVVADIGIPSRVVDAMDLSVNTVEEQYVASMIPGRARESSKGDYGKIFIVACSTGMTGAGCMAAGSAMRAGAGLVYLGVPASLTSICDGMLAESITVPLEDEGRGYLSPKCLDTIKDRISRADIVAAGPGLSVNDDIVEVVTGIIESSDKPLVLDADALNAISRNVEVLKKLKAEAVITPHPGEMARLAGITVEEVQNNKIETAREFARKWNVITVLKGAGTVIAAPDGNIYINMTGNAGMATGGAGDVLTGLIAGLMGQGMKPLDAAVAGVYLHGLAGDSAAKIIGEHGLIAGDILNMLPYVIKSVKEKAYMR